MGGLVVKRLRLSSQKNVRGLRFMWPWQPSQKGEGFTRFKAVAVALNRWTSRLKGQKSWFPEGGEKRQKKGTRFTKFLIKK